LAVVATNQNAAGRPVLPAWSVAATATWVASLPLRSDVMSWHEVHSCIFRSRIFSGPKQRIEAFIRQGVRLGFYMAQMIPLLSNLPMLPMKHCSRQ